MDLDFSFQTSVLSNEPWENLGETLLENLSRLSRRIESPSLMEGFRKEKK